MALRLYQTAESQVAEELSDQLHFARFLLPSINQSISMNLLWRPTSKAQPGNRTPPLQQPGGTAAQYSRFTVHIVLLRETIGLSSAYRKIQILTLNLKKKFLEAWRPGLCRCSLSQTPTLPPIYNP